MNLSELGAWLGARLGMAVFWLLAQLPYCLAARLGARLGGLAWRLPSVRKQVVLTNLQTCFPDWTRGYRRQIAGQVLRYVVRSFAERGMLWFGSAARIRRWVWIDDQAGLAQFKGVPHILLGMHLVGIEAGALRLSLYLDELGFGGGVTLYTPMRNRYFDAFVKNARERFGARMLPRAQIAHGLLRLIRQGVGVQISPDMDFGVNNSEFVDFFGAPACTLTAVSRLARLTGAKIIPVVTELCPHYGGYVLRILPPWLDYPGESVMADTRRMNTFFETQIVRDPAQYYWVHRRFKTRPKGFPRLY
ncbi:MAG: lauroyl acyltransferase [Ottowia sp.]|nr:lauroyl acyltransferase [Ottowia sp.]